MKRNKFIMAAITIAAAPFAAIAKNKRNMKRADKGFKVNAGEAGFMGILS